MVISEVMAKLIELKEKFGDVEVQICSVHNEPIVEGVYAEDSLHNGTIVVIG